eukprot:sb/3463012/
METSLQSPWQQEAAPCVTIWDLLYGTGVSSKDEVGANVAVPMLAPILTKAGGPLIKLELNRNQSNTVDTVEFVDEGFAVIPQGGILSFKGRVTSGRVLFLSVKVGQNEVIADNVSQCPKTCVIVTPDKGLVDAISPDKCWIDKNGKIYYCDICNSTKPCAGHDQRPFNVTNSVANQGDPGIDPVPDKEKNKEIDGMVVTEDVIVQEDIGRDLVQESAPPPNSDPPPYDEATASYSFEQKNPDFTEVQQSTWQSLADSDFAEKVMSSSTSAKERHSPEFLQEQQILEMASREQLRKFRLAALRAAGVGVTASPREHHSPEEYGTEPSVDAISTSDRLPDHVRNVIQNCYATKPLTVMSSTRESTMATQNKSRDSLIANRPDTRQIQESSEGPSSVSNEVADTKSFGTPSSEQPSVGTLSQEQLIQETSSQQSVVFRGVPENSSEDLWEIIRTILEGMSLPGMFHSVAGISRIGRENPDKARAIRVLFKKEADAVALLRLSKQPRHRIRRKGVFVCQYYSEVEMKEFYRKQRQKVRKEKEGEFIPAKIRKEGDFVPAKIRKEGDFVPAKKERGKKKDNSETPNPNPNSKSNAMEETEMEAEKVMEVEEPGAEVVDGHFKNVVMHRNME